MRRLLWIAFHGLSLLSFVLLLVLTVMWVRSYRVADFLGWKTDDYDETHTVYLSSKGLFSEPGRLSVGERSQVTHTGNSGALHKAWFVWETERPEANEFSLPHGGQGEAQSSNMHNASYWVWRNARVYVSASSVSYDSGSLAEWALTAPYWLVALLLLPLPVLILLVRRFGGK